jgi:hypothetical protein
MRELYTDDEVLFQAARPTLLHGIEDVIWTSTAGRTQVRRYLTRRRWIYGGVCGGKAGLRWKA